MEYWSIDRERARDSGGRSVNVNVNGRLYFSPSRARPTMTSTATDFMLQTIVPRAIRPLTSARPSAHHRHAHIHQVERDVLVLLWRRELWSAISLGSPGALSWPELLT